MTSKRIITWASFIIIIALIVWGLIAAQIKSNKQQELAALPGEVVATDHVRGSETAVVTVVEYEDFQCPACAQYYPIIERLLAEDASTTMRLVFRHFPLQQHANAIPAAHASEAASNQGKFWEMYSMLYEKQDEWQGLTDAKETFVSYAKALGLDTVKFAADMELPATSERVLSDYRSGVSAKVGGTPTFFVNGKQITTPQTYEQFKEILQKAATEGQAS